MIKKIQLTEGQFKQLIKESVKRVLREYDRDEWDEGFYYPGEDLNADDDFDNSDFVDNLCNAFPEMEFDFECDRDGTVKVIDLETGNYYLGEAEVRTEWVGLGYPDPHDYDSEAEGEREYYDFDEAYSEIVEKIRNGQPDGTDQEG